MAGAEDQNPAHLRHPGLPYFVTPGPDPGSRLLSRQDVISSHAGLPYSRRMKGKDFKGIVAGLEDAIAFVKGDGGRGRVAAGPDVKNPRPNRPQPGQVRRQAARAGRLSPS